MKAIKENRIDDVLLYIKDIRKRDEDNFTPLMRG